MEILHHILLGTYKCVRDNFFIQIGATSQTAKEVNALAKILGKFFAHQSDRDLPKTNFAKGIFEGKIMGKEFSGVMLLIAAILASTYGQKLLKTKHGRQFKGQGAIEDWLLLVELLLEWESFLKLDLIERKYLKRLQKKHRYLMFIMKKIVKRTEGVGFKFMKFHGILHLLGDMEAYGVPNNVDTGANESHHKVTKKAAKLTQKDMSVFEKQTATRLYEYFLLDLAVAEMDDKSVWEYFVLDQERGPVNPLPLPDNNEEPVTRGTILELTYDSDEENVGWQFAHNPNSTAGWSAKVVQYLHQLRVTARKHGVGMPEIRTEHHRGGQIFRGHPSYRGKGAWNDWAVINWGAHGRLPSEIWCFVDFSEAMEEFSFRFGGITVRRGVYAVVQVTKYEKIEEDKDQKKKDKDQKKKDKDQKKDKKGKKEAKEPDFLRNSDLFTPITKWLSDDGDPDHYLADVEAIVSTCCVIPDIGSEDKYRYFEVTPRMEWSKCFKAWLMDPYTHEKEEMEDE